MKKKKRRKFFFLTLIFTVLFITAIVTLLSVTWLVVSDPKTASYKKFNIPITPTAVSSPSPSPSPFPPKAIPTSNIVYKPPVEQAPPSGYEGIFEKYGSQYGVDVALLRQIAKCESGHRPNAINGPYGGMYQFAPGTWSTTRNRMGEDPSTDGRFNAEEAIKTAAFKISLDGTGAWPVCGAS